MEPSPTINMNRNPTKHVEKMLDALRLGNESLSKANCRPELAALFACIVAIALAGCGALPQRPDAAYR